MNCCWCEIFFSAHDVVHVCVHVFVPLRVLVVHLVVFHVMVTVLCPVVGVLEMVEHPVLCRSCFCELGGHVDYVVSCGWIWSACGLASHDPSVEVWPEKGRAKEMVFVDVGVVLMFVVVVVVLARWM